MTTEPRSSSSPLAQRPFAKLSWLGIFLLLLLAGQGCGNSQAERAVEKGVDALKNHNYDIAIADFSEAIRLKPDCTEAYYNRGLAYGSSTGEYDLAIADYSEAIRLKPDFAAAYNNRGNVYISKGEYDKALADCDEAIRLKPDCVEAYNNRGLAYYHQGDNDKALAGYNEAIRLDPNHEMAYYNRGLAYYHQGDYDKAIADYSEAIRLKPDLERPYNNLAWLLAVCPDPNVRNGMKAVEYAKRACVLSEWKHASSLDTLAAAYAEAGDFDGAVKWENKYLASNPPNDAWEKARQRLSLYEEKKPYHEEKP